MKRKTTKTKKQTTSNTVKSIDKKKLICLKNCYFGGEFYRGGEIYTMDNGFADMAANTNNFNLV
jgi:hypothetical protein